MSYPTQQSGGSAGVRPFRIEIPEAELDGLRARIAATRWPSKELVADRSQGVQSATSQELARYWAATSQPGKRRNSSQKRSAPRSGPFADRRV
jgi:hypothetical protein